MDPWRAECSQSPSGSRVAWPTKGSRLIRSASWWPPRRPSTWAWGSVRNLGWRWPGSCANRLVTPRSRRTTWPVWPVAAFAPGLACMASLKEGSLSTAVGRGANWTRLAPLLARLELPPEWSILVVIPPDSTGIHGEHEIKAFRQIPGLPDSMVDRLCRLVLLDLLPAVVERDLPVFGAALSEIQLLVGQGFAPGSRGGFCSPRSRSICDLPANRRTGRRRSKFLGADGLRVHERPTCPPHGGLGTDQSPDRMAPEFGILDGGEFRSDHLAGLRDLAWSKRVERGKPPAQGRACLDLLMTRRVADPWNPPTGEHSSAWFGWP